ncbi:MAG: MXAN_6640 family putative metalloprotease, partial [Candidatus Latescibacterota bacterium]
SRRDDLPESHQSTSGRFLIHYALEGSDRVSGEDTDGNEVPDYVEEAAAAFDSVYVLEVEKLGYRKPLSDGDATWDVYLLNLSGVYGYTYPEKTIGRGSTCYLEIDNNYTDNFFPTKGLDALRVTAAHEFFHVVQFSYYGLGGLEWWMEVCSTWMEDLAYDEVNDYYFYLKAFFDYPEKPLDTKNNGHEYGAAVFAHYLSKRFRPSVIREIWEEIRTSGQTDMRPLDRTLARFLSGGLASAMKEFAVWNYFTGSRALPDRYYPEAAHYPEVTIKKQHTEYPAASNGTLGHLAAHYIQFSGTQGRPGGLSLTFEPHDINRWWSALVGFSSEGTDTIWAVKNGMGTLVGWDAFREIALIAQVTSHTGYNFGYKYAGIYDPTLTEKIVPEQSFVGILAPNPFVVGGDGTDEVTLPFDLADPEGSTVTLSVYTLDGFLVWHEVWPDLEEGNYAHLAGWDGKNERGRTVGSGIYLVRLILENDSGTVEAVRKIAVIRAR